MISIELVPRSAESLSEELSGLERDFPNVQMVNIPDLLRFELRSWDACALALGSMKRAIPHVRAMDFALSEVPKLTQKLRLLGLSEVLVVRGDAPQDLGHAVHSTTSVELLRALRAHDPGLRLYAALDPYRRSLREELEAAEAKLEAGANGFFTQPFFDLRLLRVFADVLPTPDVFWGVSPVLSPKSRRYWEVKNRVLFPASFAPSLEWNRAFAAECLDYAARVGASLYFMPIRTSVSEYLRGLL